MVLEGSPYSEYYFFFYQSVSSSFHSSATAYAGIAGMRLQTASAFDQAQRKQFPWQPQPQKGPRTALPPA